MEADIFTIGHSTRPVEEFIDIIASAGVDLVVDVRTVPRSRTNPAYNSDALPATLQPHGIGYRRIEELGGLRKKQAVPEETNAFWQNRSFHNYADYALSDRFQEGLSELLELSREHVCAIMCAEAVWWRCHRRIIADYLIQNGKQVAHLMGPGNTQKASPTPAAAMSESGQIVYPAEG